MPRERAGTRLRRTAALRKHEAAVERAAGKALDQLRAVISSAYDSSTGFLDVALLDNRNPKWRSAVSNSVMPAISDTFGAGFRETVLDRALLSPDPFVGAHLANVENRVVGVADTVFNDIRGDLEYGRRLGESIPDLGKRIDASLARGGEFNWAGRATTIARTETISAYNVGATQAADELAKELGGYQKEWLATGDAKTRPTHMDADGQKVWSEETFDVGGEALEEPGDPAGSAEETINCRCTVLFHYPGDPGYDDNLDYGTPSIAPEDPVLEPEPIMPRFDDMVAEQRGLHPDWDDKQIGSVVLPKFADEVRAYHEQLAAWDRANWARTTEAFYAQHAPDAALANNWSDAYRRANPGYGNGPEFGINCQNVVTAFDMRMRGFNVVAEGNAVKGGLGQQWTTRWLAPEDAIMGGGLRSRMLDIHAANLSGEYSVNDAVRAVEATTKGAKGDLQWGVVYTAWRHGDAHVFNWVRDKGYVKFVEGQSRRIYGDSATMWKHMKPGTAQVVRLDDLPRPSGQGVIWRD